MGFLSGHEEQGRHTQPTKMEISASAGQVYPGMGCCWERDYYSSASGEAVTDACERRDSEVKLPDNTNNLWFAGVFQETYDNSALRQSGFVREPGMITEICPLIDTTYAATRLTCIATGAPGMWGVAGYSGRGSALALETATISKGSSIDGSATVNATALAATGAFASAAEGDKVFILGGGPSTGVLVVGVYTIDSVTDNDNVVLTSSASTSSVACLFYIITPNDDGSYPTVLAYLEDGPESGLIEYISPADDTATSSMIGGLTYICGGFTMATDDATFAFADGTYHGQRKSWKELGALTTKDYLVTLATTGLQDDHSTALDTLTFDGDGDDAELRWNAMTGCWIEDYSSGVALA